MSKKAHAKSKIEQPSTAIILYLNIIAKSVRFLGRSFDA